MLQASVFVSSWRWIELALMEYLHEKAEESRHNEIVGYLITIAGVIFLIGGTMVTVFVVPEPEWLLFIPYRLSSHPYSLMGLIFTILGYILLIFGIAFSIHSATERSWYMGRLRETQTEAEEKLKSVVKYVEKTENKSNESTHSATDSDS
jgi:cytochrome c biogenesis factor